jgi:hypothetical protein
MVRASEKGEVLLMCKMGKRPTEDPKAAAAAVTTGDQGLAEVFARLVDTEDFTTFRNVFPKVCALAHADLLAADRQATNASGVC